MADVQISGLDSLKKKLNALPKVAREAIKVAMVAGANDIVATMKSFAARFTDSGDLQMSIGWTFGKAPKGALTVATVTGSGNASDLTITIYAGNDKAFYARWVEFGTESHSTEKSGGTKVGKTRAKLGLGINHPGAKAQPFFFVSYRARKKSVVRRISTAINKSARQVAAQGTS